MSINDVNYIRDWIWYTACLKTYFQILINYSRTLFLLTNCATAPSLICFIYQEQKKTAAASIFNKDDASLQWRLDYFDHLIFFIRQSKFFLEPVVWVSNRLLHRVRANHKASIMDIFVILQRVRNWHPIPVSSQLFSAKETVPTYSSLFFFLMKTHSSLFCLSRIQKSIVVNTLFSSKRWLYQTRLLSSFLCKG